MTLVNNNYTCEHIYAECTTTSICRVDRDEYHCTIYHTYPAPEAIQKTENIDTLKKIAVLMSGDYQFLKIQEKMKIKHSPGSEKIKPISQATGEEKQRLKFLLQRIKKLENKVNP